MLRNHRLCVQCRWSCGRYHKGLPSREGVTSKGFDGMLEEQLGFQTKMFERIQPELLMVPAIANCRRKCVTQKLSGG